MCNYSGVSLKLPSTSSQEKVTRYLLHVKYSLIHSTMETVKRSVIFRSSGLGSNEQAEHRGFLSQWSYFVWYYDDGFMSLYISSNLWNVNTKNKPSVQFSLVTQSCLTLCDPMNHSTPGLPVHHQLLEFTQTHIQQVSDAIQPSHPLSSPLSCGNIITYPYRFTHCNKHITLIGNVDHMGDCAVGSEGTWENSIIQFSSVQFSR